MPGDCHYLEGNYSAKRRLEYLKKLLHEIGLEPERVEMFNLSSAMAGQFVEITKNMTEKISALGPNPLKSIGGKQ
jgi:coenzyme F420-reducing hydrogenase delta subunit